MDAWKGDDFWRGEASAVRWLKGRFPFHARCHGSNRRVGVHPNRGVADLGAICHDIAKIFYLFPMTSLRISGGRILCGLILSLVPVAAWMVPVESPAAGGQPVSYFNEVRPIFQANCQGCHQPAKAKGGYVMTDLKKLFAGGEKEGVAVVPGDVSKGSLLEQIQPVDGSAEMPKNKPPLAESQLAVIRRWIAEGAKDDTPADAVAHFDAEHPPVYPRLPVVASMDYSPDGSLLAVSGFHEILLHKADGSGLAGRLIGISQRIQSVRFSPDGKWLAAAGGDPGRMGEVQVWEVATGRLKNSLPVGWDTLHGVSWSPDGTQVAFGCADNTVRVLEVQSGKQLLQMGSHNDWALETVFSVKGDHVVSVGRDMTVKLSDVPGQRFIDNVTSITPGALRGGLDSVDRHPEKDIIAVGGADGSPQLFQIFRTAARKIGDNANLVKKYDAMTGRVSVVRFSRDGRLLAAVSALDGAGELSVFSVGEDFTGPKRIQDLRGKPAKDRTPQEAAEIAAFENDFGWRTVQVKLPVAPYALAFHPDGTRLAVAGSDGMIRFVDAAAGSVQREFAAAPVQAGAKPPVGRVLVRRTAESAVAEGEVAPDPAQVQALEVSPDRVEIGRRNDAVQLLVTARLASGEVADVTRLAKLEMAEPVASLTPRGRVLPARDGETRLRVSYAGRNVEVLVKVAGSQKPFEADFVKDVNPVMTKLGCNQGACHGSKNGKGGFKLSLRGYDPLFDVRALTDEVAGRRVSLSSPDDSLMLLKAIAEVPHEGGRRCENGDPAYQILRQWIADGARLSQKAARVKSIELLPGNPVLGQVGSRLQMRVVATYTDGVRRDVTADAFLDSGNVDVSTVDGSGLVQTLRRGEAPMLARFEGSYAATTVTVMGDRKGFEWKPPQSWGRIDELAAAKWQRMKIEPSDLCTDGEFLRRVSLDLTGLPPGPDELKAFLADPRPTREKRDAAVDRLIGTPEFLDHWTNKWSDMLQVNAKFLGREGADGFRVWIRSQLEKNVPYDQFVRSILTAQGSNFENPAASYWKVLRQPAEAMENTTHLFLATRFNCNKCHDHPFERWTQDQYYQTGAYFAQFTLADDAANSKGRRLGGTAVEGAKPLFEKIVENPAGTIVHDRTGAVTEPQFPYPAKAEVDPKSPRRVQLAAWMTSPDNRYFASSYANRLWGYLLGRGLIEPLDDIRAGNPPSNPELLEHLSRRFVESGFNVRSLLREICTSRTYQLSIQTNRWNADDTTNYSHAVARRLPAETLFDAVYRVTGSSKGGQRATSLVENEGEMSTFLATLGRPLRESACECERSSELRLGSVMALLSGPTVSSAIQDPKNALAGLVAQHQDDANLVNALFLRVLSRDATAREIEATRKLLATVDSDHQKIAAAWQAKEKEQAPVIARMEKEREAAISKATAELGAYEAATQFYREEREKVRKEREAQAAQALKAFEEGLAERTAGWLASTKPAADAPVWVALKPREARASLPQAALKVQPDGSILASGANNRTDYVVTLDTDLQGITGLLLEVLPDASLPEFGPGRAKNGNFVLNSIALKAAAKGKPEAVVGLKEAWASFSQDKYPVAAAIGAEEDAKGWALAGGLGRRQVAAFRLEQPLPGGAGTTLRVTLSHKQPENVIGRFRLHVTTSANPLGAGLPAGLHALLTHDPAARTPEQVKAVSEHLRVADPEYWRLKKLEASARQPLQPDPKHTGLQQALASAKEPIRLDPALVQVREDMEASKRQVANKRLTVVQDLTWALVNNPAFLFNR